MNEEEVCILDEVVDFIGAHVVADDARKRVMTLYAAATWAMPEAFVTFPRLLFTTEQSGLDGKNSGKTTAMHVTGSVSANPESAKGTYASLRSKLAAASNKSDYPVITLEFDQVDGNYGNDGQGKGSNPTLTMLLQEGYKEGSTDSWSVNRTEHKFSLVHPVMMTGNDTSLPSDIRQRCVVVTMTKGKPRRYFSVRESQAEATDLGKALGAVVRTHLDELKAFRARGIHDKLSQRLLEVWEALFAAAWVIGGQRWLNWCREAFETIGLNSEMSALSPRQQVIRDSADALSRVAVSLPNGREFAEGIKLAAELKLLENDIYATKTPLGTAMLIAESMPFSPKQVRVGQDRINGYYADDIRKAWDDIKPDDAEDTLIPEEENPFAVSAVSDDDFDEVFDIPDQPASVRASGPSARKKAVKQVLNGEVG